MNHKVVTLASILFTGALWSYDSALPQELRQPAPRLRIAQERVCPQVIHCGTKNGQVKEYPTRCAAEDDGATDIAPRAGPTCSANR